ncbi:MAG: hypothetical protein GX410_09525, partial [Elusimicrobia bacterium]|nr:hypothetical protein [Elusimicrobiota bacterium]
LCWWDLLLFSFPCYPLGILAFFYQGGGATVSYFLARSVQPLLNLNTSSEVTDKFRLWGNIACNIPDNLELSGDPVNLPETVQPRHIPTTMLRSYLSLLGIANRLEEAVGVTGFSEAVISTMQDADRGYALHMSPEIRRGLAAGYLLSYINNPEHPPHPEHGYRLDVLAAYLEQLDAEAFTDMDATELGKMLAQMRIGITSRVVFPAERGRLNRIWRTCIVFSEEGKLKMEEQSNEL